VLGRKTVELMMKDHLPAGVEIKPFLHMAGGHGFGLGGSVLLDAAANGAIGSEGMFSWGGAANTYMCLDPVEGVGFIMMTQLMPSFQICVWRREVQALIMSSLI
jgi:CubicO group peptidase (beta-lactamase class C family)